MLSTRTKPFLVLLALLSIGAVWFMQTSLLNEYYETKDFQHQSRTNQINHNEAASHVSKSFDEFSNFEYISLSTGTNDSINSAEDMKLAWNHHATYSNEEIQQLSCQPSHCNNGVCFENMLCYDKLPTLLPQFKNPCFYEKVTADDSDQNVHKNYIARVAGFNTSTPVVRGIHQSWQSRRHLSDTQLRCLPYFFTIGMEKCGTTDLYRRISMHPQVVRSTVKELQWWTRRRFVYSVNNTFSRELQSDEFKLQHVSDLVSVPFKHYYAFFDGVADKINSTTESTVNGVAYHRTITGDASANTMYWNDFQSIFNTSEDSPNKTLVAHHVAATLPKARIIAILRNPVDRLYSSYLFFNRGASKDDFHRIVTEGIKLFIGCVSVRTVRDCVYDPKLKEQVSSTVNIMQGIYSVMLKDWLQVFPASQVHVVHFETYQKSEIDTINEIFKFLDVAPVSKLDRIGQRIMAKDKARAGQQYKYAGHMMPQTRTLLNDFYKPFNKELAELLKDERYSWGR